MNRANPDNHGSLNEEHVRKNRRGSIDLRTLLYGNLPSKKITQVWTEEGRIDFISLHRVLLRSLVSQNKRVIFITGDADLPNLPCIISSQGEKCISPLLKIYKVSFFEEIEEILKEEEKYPATLILDGISKVMCHSQRGKGYDDADLVEIDKAELNAEKKIMNLLQQRTKNFDFPVLFTSYSNQFYRSGGYSLGFAPDKDPVLFYGSDISIELIPDSLMDGFHSVQAFEYRITWKTKKTWELAWPIRSYWSQGSLIDL